MIRNRKDGQDELDRIESLLRDSADFSPDSEPDYNFAARALADKVRRRRGISPVWATAAGCAAVATVMGSFFLHSFEFGGGSTEMAQAPMKGTLPPPHFPKEIFHTPDGRAIETVTPAGGDSTSEREIASSAAVRPPVRERAARRNRTQPRVQDEARPPKVEWESESVESYASGVLTYAWKEERDPKSGETILKPVVVNTPLESGQRPLAEGASDHGAISLVSYEE
jgi:hypothetical protein